MVLLFPGETVSGIKISSALCCLPHNPLAFPPSSCIVVYLEKVNVSLRLILFPNLPALPPGLAHRGSGSCVCVEQEAAACGRGTQAQDQTCCSVRVFNLTEKLQTVHCRCSGFVQVLYDSIQMLL